MGLDPPPPVHMRPPEPDPLPLRVDVINGWPLSIKSDSRAQKRRRKKADDKLLKSQEGAICRPKHLKREKIIIMQYNCNLIDKAIVRRLQSSEVHNEAGQSLG